MNQELKHEGMKKADKPDSSKREKEKKRVALFHQQFNQAEQAVSGKQKQWAIIDLFDRGDQWKNVDLPPWIPKPMHNMIRYIRILKRANLAGNIPAAHFSAINVMQTELVQKLQKAYKHVWDTEKVPLTIRRCIDRSLLQGTAIAFVYSEDTYVGGQYYGEGHKDNQLFQGRIRVKRFPIMNFFPDPDASSLEECRWIETTEPTTLEIIKANKKFKEYAGDKLLDITSSSSNSDTEAGTILQRDHSILESQQPNEKDTRLILHTRWELEIDEETSKQKLNVSYYLTGTDFLLYEALDEKPSRYPCAVLYDEEEEQDFFGTATADNILEKQKLINKTEQAASIIGTMNQNPQKIVARESGINGQDMSRTGTLPGKVWVSNIEPSRAVHTIAPVDIPKGLFDLKDRAVNDIREDAGINEAYSGDSVGSLTTSTGVTSLIERATVRDKDKMIQIDNFVCQLSELIVLFILEKWKEDRPIINVGPAGKVDRDMWTPIDKSDAENLEWFVRSDVYASAPTTQALKKDQANNLLQVQEQFQSDPPLITLEEWLHVQDFDNKDEILARMTRDREAKAEREAKDFAQIVMQMAEEARKLIATGEPKEMVMEMLKGQAKEALDGNAKKDTKIGFNDSSTGSRPRDAEAPNGRPPASMSAQANQNMVRG